MPESSNSVQSVVCWSEALAPLRGKDKELKRVILLILIPPMGT